MATCKTYNKKKIMMVIMIITILSVSLIGRLAYIMLFRSEYYTAKAEELHQRERSIKAARGKIIDANGVVLATNKTVCTISVIYNQVKEPEKVISMLVKELGIEEAEIRKKVEKRSSREKIKANVSKEVGDKIREYDMEGVKVDEDFKRYYPYSELASKVLGFTGADNQGIIGLEVKYDNYLEGTNGTILTLTDARGVELEGALEQRQETVPGNNLHISLDMNIQKYAQQIAYKTLESKGANYVSIIVMNPKNGEILALVNAPEFDLNDPYTLNYDLTQEVNSKEKQDLLNKMWRNQCINDTYEPGSVFKIFTAAAGLEEKVVDLKSTFSCPGFKIVEDRKIRCHKTTGHGAENFLEGIMNSCNPVFMTVGERIGVEGFYKHFKQVGLMNKTGVDLPGEASTIIHKIENVGPVELATMSFGQSFQITPMQMITAASAVINGGKRVIPHLGVEVQDADGKPVQYFKYNSTDNAVSKETSDTMKYMLEKVVSEGSGKKGAVEGYDIGGKTATSQKLPRSAGKYISSYIGFAPADDPSIIAMALVDEPQGIYYGGTVAAPMIKELYENVLPYLNIKKSTKEPEKETK